MTKTPASISRRRLFGFIGGYVGATALGIAVSRPQEPKEPLPDAIGMLYDTTKCIGCKACVSECSRINGLEPDTEMSGGVWAMPMGLDVHTKNIIKLYESDDGQEWSFVKRQCMHCVDPACVDGCPSTPFTRARRGSSSGTAPAASDVATVRLRVRTEVPKFEWEEFNPKIVKCEFCRHVLGKPEEEGGQSEPGCTMVCPTGAVIFGTRAGLLDSAKGRIAEEPRQVLRGSRLR